MDPKDSKVSVGVFVGRFIPAYRSGGPIQSLRAITADRGAEVAYTVFTKDRDNGDAVPFTVSVPRRVVDFEGRRVMYVDVRRPFSYLRAFRTFVRLNHDIYYFNSLWNRWFTIAPLTLILLGIAPRRPVLLAPRGELLLGARLQKQRRKQIGLRFVRFLLSKLEVTVHCTSADEVKAVRAFLPGYSIALVPGTFVASEYASHASLDSSFDPDGPLRVCYLSRIDVQKNLAGAIAAVGQVKTPIHFRVVGPVANREYHSHCLRVASQLPSHVRIEFVGPAHHDDVPDTLSWAGVYLLPTKGENFGHAIREALAAGLCPLISNSTPWTEVAVQAGGAALDWSDTQGFARELDRLATMPAEERLALRRRVANAYRRWADAQTPSVTLMDNLFLRLARTSLPPATQVHAVSARAEGRVQR